MGGLRKVCGNKKGDQRAGLTAASAALATLAATTSELLQDPRGSVFVNIHGSYPTIFGSSDLVE